MQDDHINICNTDYLLAFESSELVLPYVTFVRWSSYRGSSSLGMEKRGPFQGIIL